METDQAVEKLSALAQETRLRIFLMLVQAGEGGRNASAIAETLQLAPATLSFHVANLVRAGLVQARPESRFIYYAACYGAMDELIAFLTDNCCQGRQCLPKTAVGLAKKHRRTAAKGEAA